MSTARVSVIRSFRVGEVWFMESAEPASMDAQAAREWEAKGYCEILEVDGTPAVWGACCDGAHT